MKHLIGLFVLILAMVASGCSSDQVSSGCIDLDGDGYGTGDDCSGPDCDDSVSSCNTDCTTDTDNDSLRDCDDTCLDADSDGYGTGDDCSGPDCDDAVANCNTDCVTDSDNDSLRDCDDPCLDADGDNYGDGALCLGTDCDDNDPNCNSGDCCIDCLDPDGDGYGQGSDCAGPDCNESDENCQQGVCCDDCTDLDGDGYGIGDACSGPDCDDTDIDCNTDCTTDLDGDDLRDCNDPCLDADGDNYGTGAGCSGADCDDTAPDCNVDCVTDIDGDSLRDCDDPCVDSDGDNYGTGAGCLGVDCDDSVATCNTDCTTDLDTDSVRDCEDPCVDVDGDNYGSGPACLGPDCDDAVAVCNVDCLSDIDNDSLRDCDDPCLDLDGDGYGIGEGCLGTDCNDSNPDCQSGACCVDCTDQDGDGYGDGTECIGPDCDDAVFSCNTDCLTDTDNDSLRDCDDPCLDADSDNYGTGTGCLGADCDDAVASCNIDCVTDIDNDAQRDCDDPCIDVDTDGYGEGAGCSGPDCDDAVASCNVNCVADTDNDSLRDCDDPCVDVDSDGYGTGAGCTGPDCDDAVASCNVNCVADTDNDGLRDCDDPCVDVDTDGYGAGAACTGPDCDDAVFVCNVDCVTDSDNDSLRDCDDPCIDVDTDGYGVGAACTGPDCDDDDINVHPGAIEDCVDGIDNNCDNLTDLEDVVSCPPITVTINTWSDPRLISHGRNDSFSASIVPDDPNPTAPFVWSRQWKIVDAQPAGPCNVADVTLSGQSDWQTGSQIQVSMPDVLSKKDCIYTIELRVNLYATDTARMQMINRIPDITSVSNAVFDGSAWRLHVAAGTPLSLTANAWDQDNDNPINFDWSGPDLDVLSCAATSCQSSDGSSPFQTIVNWDSNTTPGNYLLTVEAWDDFEPGVSNQVDVIVEVDNCVWVEQGGSGTGTLGDPLGSIAAGLTQASTSADTNVCVIGAGTFNENLILPVAPNMPDMLGGFDAAGNLSTNRPIIISSVAAGLGFVTGYNGTIHHFSLQQSSTDAVTVTIEGASPVVSDCFISGAAGQSPVGVHVNAQNMAAAPTEPVILGGQVQMSSGASQDATAIRIEESPGADADPDIIGVGQIGVWSCSGVCRAIHLLPGTQAEILNTQSIGASSDDDTAIGIDLEGSNARRVSAIIDGSNNFNVDTQGLRSIAINLWRTTDVQITNNNWIGATWNSAGTQMGLGIADGYVLRDGTVAAGESDNLTISGNMMISGGASWWAQPCNNPGATGEGTDVTVGVLLVGTQTATITGNGRPNDMFGGIFGGNSTIHWDPISRRLPPSAIGLWLIDTDDVTVVGNELRSGTYMDFLDSCPNPDIASDPSPEIPVASAYRDGLPPNDDMGFMPVPGELPSRNTVLDKNGASCAIPPEGVGMGAGLVTWCAAAEINVPQGATAPLLTNNHLAATRGNFLIALWQRAGNGVMAINNTLDSDLVLIPWEPPPNPNSIRKWAVFADNIDPDGLTLINNIIYTHNDDPYDIVSERLCMREAVPNGTNSNIHVLDHNLFYIEGDDLSDPSAPDYVRVTDYSATTNYAPSALNAIAGIGTILGNFADLPGMHEHSEDWQKSMARLTAASAAIDAGASGNLVPPDDIDNERRPNPGGAVDIGHDEYYP
ncbi:MAG: hypothetical protein JRJ87_11945 [Deltaproteobacteria bacterium]|nr:hypothetical protein [Deltaproteobacteria bacterium]